MRIDGASTTDYMNKSQRATQNQLGKEEFLKILITQLRHQDPLKPVEDKDFIAQMAQFSTLEQMQNMNREFSDMKALSLVGKMIYAEKDVENAAEIIPVLGRVSKVSFLNGRMYLHVMNNVIESGDVIQVYSEEEAQKLTDWTQEVDANNE